MYKVIGALFVRFVIRIIMVTKTFEYFRMLSRFLYHGPTMAVQNAMHDRVESKY